MRIIVCGGRDFADVAMLWRVMDRFAKQTPEPISLVIEGASDDVTGPYVGTDYWVHEWALARGIATSREHAKWKEQGRAAGPIRNGEMLRRHTPQLVIAFQGQRGTADMIDQTLRAVKTGADIKIFLVDESGRITRQETR